MGRDSISKRCSSKSRSCCKEPTCHAAVVVAVQWPVLHAQLLESSCLGLHQLAGQAHSVPCLIPGPMRELRLSWLGAHAWCLCGSQQRQGDNEHRQIGMQAWCGMWDGVKPQPCNITCKTPCHAKPLLMPCASPRRPWLPLHAGPWLFTKIRWRKLYSCEIRRW